MKKINNTRFGEERALYAQKHLKLITCRFQGEEDGESALKECTDIVAQDCYFDLRYPMWHVKKIKLDGCELTQNCRAPLWYDEGVTVTDSRLHGVKALRECKNVTLTDCDIVSPEFCWRSQGIKVTNGTLTGEYAFFESKNITVKNLHFTGKYSFQYVKNVKIKGATLNTKDAFWHAENVVVEDSEVNGEYLGWYAKNITFINCKIKGTQPLCYCKNVKLVNCTMEGCDFSFEYSSVNADVKGNILSVKNVASGKIVADGFGEIILTQDSVKKLNAQIVTRSQTIKK